MNKKLIVFFLFIVPLYVYGDESNVPPVYQNVKSISSRLEDKEILKAINDISPYVAERIKVIIKDKPRVGRFLIGSLRRAYNLKRRLETDIDGKKFAARFWELSVKEKELALKIREGSKKSVSKLNKELNKVVSELFELRQKAREIRIKKMEENLKRIKEELKERERNKKEIVKDHIDKLLGKKRRISW